MKKILIAVAALVISFSAFAQGTVSFATRVIGATAKVYMPDGVTGPGLASTPITAQLALVGAGGSLTLLTPTTTFQTGLTTAWYVNTTTVTVPGFGTGSTPTLRMLAFQSSFGSYDAAKAGGGLYGFSNDIVTLGLGGAGSPPVTSPNLVGLTGFTLRTDAVPEPTTLALLGLGGLALAIRRRK